MDYPAGEGLARSGLRRGGASICRPVYLREGHAHEVAEKSRASVFESADLDAVIPEGPLL